MPSGAMACTVPAPVAAGTTTDFKPYAFQAPRDVVLYAEIEDQDGAYPTAVPPDGRSRGAPFIKNLGRPFHR